MLMTELSTQQLNSLLATAQAGLDVEASKVPESEDRDEWFAKFKTGVEAGKTFHPVCD